MLFKSACSPTPDDWDLLHDRRWLPVHPCSQQQRAEPDHGHSHTAQPERADFHRVASRGRRSPGHSFAPAALNSPTKGDWWRWEVGGGLRIVNAEKSLIFDEQMLEPGMKFPSSRLEAVYAVLFEDSHVNVIITNTTAQPLTVNGDATFVGANGHRPIQSQLGPYQTQV